MKSSYGSTDDPENDGLEEAGGEETDPARSFSFSSSSETSSDPEAYIHSDRAGAATPSGEGGGGDHPPPLRTRSLSMKEKAELYDEQAEAADRIGELLALAAAEEERAVAAGVPGDGTSAELAAKAADEVLRRSLGMSPEELRGMVGVDDEAAGGGAKGGGTTPPLEMDGGGRMMSATEAVRKSIRQSMRRPSAGGRSASMLYGTWEPKEVETPKKVLCKVVSMIFLAAGGVLGLMALLALGEAVVGPPNQPVGSYRLLELQEGEQFFDYYNFYAGPDSVGSNGYITYVSKDRAKKLGIARVTTEPVPEDELPDGATIGGWDDDDAADDDDAGDEIVEVGGEDAAGAGVTDEALRTLTSGGNGAGAGQKGQNWSNTGNETFVYLSSAPTEEGPRESIRLEGKRRFNRGLFILDLRHMPAGCGAWPAFWMTDEANWPVNGEIDIVEGVSYQSEAKTALHSTKGCNMDDVPNGVKTGAWDTAVGIPDKKTGIPDMTFRYATDCFVYDPHQWINQGCVAVDVEGGTLGGPLNDKGGGVYALEWDPVNRHIRTWVFTPHRRVPPNLMDSIRTAAEAPATRIAPNPDEWGLPYGYFPIGEGTNCPSGHFRNMRLVINLAFCGSVAGNRYFMDCPQQFKKYKTCNEWVKSDPKELEEAYWKIRGVYVYERTWEKKWV